MPIRLPRPARIGRNSLVGGCTAVFIVALLSAGMLTKSPGHALPEYARRYDVTCQACHTVAPHLNAFGQAFQANNFNWPGPRPTGLRPWLQTLPLSGLATSSRAEDLTQRQTDTNFRTLELFLSDGFRVGGRRAGGFFVDNVVGLRDGRGGDLGNAFAALPVLGARGELTLTAGQFTPLMYQYDPINSLTQSLPASLIADVDTFSFADPTPGLRLDYFDHRGRATADGTYAAVGVPFAGHLTFNRDSRLYGPRGVFVHAFRRQGGSSWGLFGYGRAGNSLGGVLGTYRLGERLYLLGAGTAGHDAFQNTRALSLQADYIAGSGLAFTGRLEAATGVEAPYPVAAVTYYPFRQSVIRLTAETIQAKGSRSDTAYLFVQF